MKKSILKINGVQELNKENQRHITGGWAHGSCCKTVNGVCVCWWSSVSNGGVCKATATQSCGIIIDEL